MATNEYRTFATNPGANVLSPAAYGALPARLTGFMPGLAESDEANTPWRQASVATSALAQLVLNETNVDMLDDGDRDAFALKFKNAIISIVNDIVDTTGSFGSGSIFGMIMSNTAGFTTTRITISAGQCRDSLNINNLVVVTPLTKRLDQPWAAGNNNGGRDTGTLANGQTWHMFAIFNPTTEVVDALFSQSATAPTLPSGYTRFRRIGAIILEASSTAIRQFLQTDDWFKLKTRSTDFAATANGAGPYLRQITVPAGIKVEAEIYFQTTNTTGSGGPDPSFSGLYDPDMGVPGAFGVPTQWAQFRASGAAAGGNQVTRYGTVIVRQFTDSARNIYTYSNDPNDAIVIGVLGWRDQRGRYY